MKLRLSALFAVALALALALPATSNAADRSSQERVVSALGKKVVRGQTAHVEVLVVVPAGRSARKAKRTALRDQGAEPVESSGFATNGLVWDVLPVEQSYNPAGQPLNAAGAPLAAQTALINTHGAWSSVSGSSYRMSFGGQTSRCPSLVGQCRGPQTFDGFNDVGWARLGGSTLGVTWYGLSRDEADMALSTRFAWSESCVKVNGRYDVQTVYLHENGHVAGLDHSSDRSAVMYASYQGVRCALSADDQNGLRTLYPR